MKMWRKLSKLSSEDIGCYWVPLQQCPTLQCVGEEEKRLLGWLKREGLVLCPVQGLVCSLGESGEKEITLKDFFNLLIEWTNVAVEWLGDTDDAKNFVRHVKVVSKSKDDIDSTILQLQAIQSSATLATWFRFTRCGYLCEQNCHFRSDELGAKEIILSKWDQSLPTGSRRHRCSSACLVYF